MALKHIYMGKRSLYNHSPHADTMSLLRPIELGSQTNGHPLQIDSEYDL